MGEHPEDLEAELDLDEPDEDDLDDEDELDAEMWDMTEELANAVNLVGRLSLLGLMRERGASPGLRQFAQTFGIRLKDKNVSMARLIHRVSRELGSTVSHVHAAAAAPMHTEDGEPDFAAAFARLGLKSDPEMSLAILAGYSFSKVSANPSEAVEAHRQRAAGEMSVAEATMAVTVLSLAERYLSESRLVESAVAVERAHNVERERDKLAEEIKRLRRLAQEHKGEIAALRKQKVRPVAPASPVGPDREEIRALRRENHELRKQLEELRQGLHPEPWLREQHGAPTEGAPLPALESAAARDAPLDIAVVRGKSVLVVGGDSKEHVYREIVEGFGGRFTFMSGFDARPIGRDDVAGFDAVLFVSTQLRHAVFDRVKGHAKALAIPFRIVTFKGNEAFTAALVECLSREPG